jgi:hypothetical protein
MYAHFVGTLGEESQYFKQRGFVIDQQDGEQGIITNSTY